MKTGLEGWLAGNTVATGNKEGEVPILESAGSLALSDVLNEVKKGDAGLRVETLKYAIDLLQRTISGLMPNGYSINTELFRAIPQFRGIIDGGIWNPGRNSIYVSFSRDRDLRGATARADMKILRAKGGSACFTNSKDAATHVTDDGAAAGRSYRLQDENIKVAGIDSTVGIVSVGGKDTETKLPMGMIVVNSPSEVLVLLPTDLKNGTYKLRPTIQYYHSSRTMLKTPRAASRFISIDASQESGDGGIVDSPTA